MARSSTIYRLDLQVSDLDRDYYQTHSLTVAQHPSETRLRMMVRILVFALNAGEQLKFTKGLSTDSVPDLWEKTLTGDIGHWIEVGQPTPRRIKKACNQAAHVSVYPFSGHSAELWWQQNRADLTILDTLRVINFCAESITGLQQFVARSMALQCTIQDNMVWLGNAQASVEISPEIWLESSMITRLKQEKCFPGQRR